MMYLGLLDLFIAYTLAIPIGWNREAEVRNAGLRTFPLVALGSCGFMLVGLQSFHAEEALARVFYGLITGIGFIGGGAILKGKGNVSGTATAASIWITGAMGAAVALHRFEVAVFLSLLNFVTLRWISPLKEVVRENQEGEPL
jgi:putative Mg2+ transporter-C (MgtC) family protein